MDGDIADQSDLNKLTSLQLGNCAYLIEVQGQRPESLDKLPDLIQKMSNHWDLEAAAEDAISSGLKC